MDELLNSIAALVTLVSPEKVQAVAASVRRTDATGVATTLMNVVGTPVAAKVIEQLVTSWQNTKVGPNELASMLLAASYVYTKAASVQSTELVWTGPTTPFVSARRTEQALLEVINSSERTLFITSFVAYDVSTVIRALNTASHRGVVISMLLELSQEEGGRVDFNVVDKMRALVPAAKLYVWSNKSESFSGGSVHAKVAVADAKICFITSANLTGYAMEKNMEAGVLISGGRITNLLDEHLRSLVATKIVSPA